MYKFIQLKKCKNICIITTWKGPTALAVSQNVYFGNLNEALWLAFATTKQYHHSQQQQHPCSTTFTMAVSLQAELSAEFLLHIHCTSCCASKELGLSFLQVHACVWGSRELRQWHTMFSNISAQRINRTHHLAWWLFKTSLFFKSSLVTSPQVYVVDIKK